MKRRAFLSVSDKTGLVPFAKGLAECGFELVSTGGTERALKEAGVPAELIRISLGLEDKEDLIADISAALDAI